MREFLIQPGSPQLVEEAVETRAVVFDKLRIDAAFHGVQSEQRRGEAVDGSDLAALDLPERIQRAAIQSFLREMISSHQGADFRAGIRVFCRRRRGVQPDRDVRFQPLAQAHFYLVGGFVGESERDDLSELRFRIAHQEVRQPVDQQARLSRARARRDRDVAVEGGCGALALQGIRQRGRRRHIGSTFLSLKSAWALRRRSLSTLHIVGRWFFRQASETSQYRQ